MAQVMQCLREQAKAAARYRGWAARLYSAQAAPVQEKDDPRAAAAAMRANEAMIVQLKSRPMSPFTTISQATVQEWAKMAAIEGELPNEVGVIRDAFTPHYQPQRPLSHLIKSKEIDSLDSMVISSALCRPTTRAVVDVYAFVGNEGNSFDLVVPSLDLMSFLWGQDVSVRLAGDIQTAPFPTGHKQSTNEVLMVAPTAFGFNEQTAQDNHFMHEAAHAGDSESGALVDTVTKEFAGLHYVLSEVHGVNVSLMQHSLMHGTPDAVFPNNWFSTHDAAEPRGTKDATSTMVLYPMKCPNRAAERRPELVDFVKSRGYAAEGKVIDMTHMEKQQKYFEGTGVLVIDRVNGVAYVSTSERADKDAAEQWVKDLGYNKLVTFESQDSAGQSIYHTNVMMAVGTSVAVVCGASIGDSAQRQHLFDTLGSTHEIIDITHDQMDRFCGNVLELEDGRGLPIMAMSTQAYNAFTEEQKETILRHCADIAHAPVDTIERVGGGGVRCMLAELF